MSSPESLPQTFEQNREKLKAAQESLELPEAVVDTAVMIYKQSYWNDLYHGRPINDILSACLHLGCKIEQTPCNPTNIASVFETERQKVLKTSRHFKSELGLKPKPVDPSEYIDDFCSSLSLSPETHSLAHDILEAFVNSNKNSGKSPTGLAAGAIYAATQETDDRVKQDVLSEIASVSKVTIRSIYHQQQKEYEEQSSVSSAEDVAKIASTPSPN